MVGNTGIHITKRPLADVLSRQTCPLPRPKLAALGGKYAEILAVYDEVTGNLVLAEPSSGTVLPVPLTTVALPTMHTPLASCC